MAEDISKVYVLIDHVCEADILVGVFSSRAMAKAYIRKRRAMERWPFESPEIYEEPIDGPLRVLRKSA